MPLGTDEDPFKDPSLDGASTQPLSRPQPPSEIPATLAAGRDASLTLGTDSLIVLGTDTIEIFTGELTWFLDKALQEKGALNCCGVGLSRSQSSRLNIISWG